MLGLAKRDLLRDVLRELGASASRARFALQFARSLAAPPAAKQRVTAPLAAEYQEILKKISAA